jgi:hypothetical protein
MPLERWFKGSVARPFLGATIVKVALALTTACSSAPGGAPPQTVDTRPDLQAPKAYDVTWHRTLLEFIGTAPANQGQSALATRLDQAWEDALQLTNGQRTIEARVCRALLELDGTYETVVPSELSIFQDRSAQCRAAALLVQTKPSQSSFLHDFVLDAQAPLWSRHLGAEPPHCRSGGRQR